MKHICVIAMSAMALVVHAQVGTFKPYSVSSDLHEVSNLRAFSKAITLTPEHKALLRKNLFFVSPGGEEQLYYVYAKNDYQNLPSLVTTDSVLHLYHVMFDGTLRTLEQEELLPRLKQMSAKLLAESKKQSETLTDPAMKEAALKNVSYFSVAVSILQPGTKAASPAAQAELDYLIAAKGNADSPIFGHKVDYSRFIVRGHYSKTKELGRYFKAMTWFGMMPFALADQNGKPVPDQIRMAVLAAQAVKTSGADPDWKAIYVPTSLYVGASNMATPEDIREVVANTFLTPNKLAPDKFAAFVAGVKALRPARIKANLRLTENAPGAEVQFRLMGLRYIPDSEILQRLSDAARPMPTGLDVMSVLGSSRASTIIDTNPKRYNSHAWIDYAPERAKLMLDFALTPQDMWSSNLYWSWFDTLRLLLKPVPQGYPQFMTGPAWHDKNLSTALASWAELRHDTILYGEQSAAEGDGEDEIAKPPPFVKGFVEPNVAVYTRLQALSKQSRVRLQALGVLKRNIADDFVQYEELLGFLVAVSKKELAGTPLTKAEHQRIRKIEGELGDMTSTMLYYGNDFKALTSDDWNMALIADVHTGDGMALEEAVGKSDDLIAIVPIEGKLYLARGAVFSYYEFAKPVANRLTDEQWKSILENEKDPARPHWTGSFFTAKPAEEKD